MHQDIQGFAYAYNPAITSTEDLVDEDGNSYRFSWWGSPDDPYPGTIGERIYSLTNTFTAILIDTLDGMPSTTEFPIPSGTIPPEVTRYLEPGTYTQSDEQEIIDHANGLVSGCTAEYEAVMRIVDWCIDNVTYYGNPPQHDALWILRDPTHRAQCAGYSHMAVALLKAVGIPARYVGGMSISGSYWMPGPGGGGAWFGHGQGTHAWLEVYCPDTGWIPHDAQGLYHYVDTRVYKRCIGIDMDDRRPSQLWYAYWEPAPTLAAAHDWNSAVVFDIPEIEYYTTYPTPNSQAFGDHVLAFGSVELTRWEESSQSDFGIREFSPNPFASRAEIRYGIPRDSDVRLEIYDVRGRRVARLANMRQQVGSYMLAWDGRDGAGEELASGVYFCRLQAGSSVDVRKIILMR